MMATRLTAKQLGALSNMNQPIIPGKPELGAMATDRDNSMFQGKPEAGAMMTDMDNQSIEDKLREIAENRANARAYEDISMEDKGVSPVAKKKGGEVKTGKDWHGFGSTGTGKNNHGF